jgi:hypothetical protein
VVYAESVNVNKKRNNFGITKKYYKHKLYVKPIMPYKDKNKQREAVRKSVQKLRTKQKSIIKKAVIPEIVKPNNRTPAGKISNQAVNEILTQITQLAEQQKIFYEQLINSQLNSRPTIKETPKGKKFIFYVYD